MINLDGNLVEENKASLSVTNRGFAYGDAVFENMYKLLAKGGILTTYCAKGVVKRSMKAAGLEVEELLGPPRKREMTRAWKR